MSCTSTYIYTCNVCAAVHPDRGPGRPSGWIEVTVRGGLADWKEYHLCRSCAPHADPVNNPRSLLDKIFGRTR